VSIGWVKERECEKGSRKQEKDNGQLKKKDKRRFHCGSEHPGTLDTRRGKAVVSVHSLKDHSINNSPGSTPMTKIAAV